MVNRERKSCRAKYYKLNIDKLKEYDPKSWWSEVKRISNFNNKQDPISFTNVETFSNLTRIERANEINKAFLGPLEEYRLQCSLPHLPLTETSIHPEVSEIRVQNVLSKLPTNRASGPDKLPNWVLKEYSYVLALPITLILNAFVSRTMCAYCLENGQYHAVTQDENCERSEKRLKTNFTHC